MASGPITSWEIDGETVKTVTDFIFLGSTITADDDCSHEIKRHLLLRRKARRDKKAFLRDQCKELEENNRMGKTRDLFKKIRDTKGTFHANLVPSLHGK